MSDLTNHRAIVPAPALYHTSALVPQRPSVLLGAPPGALYQTPPWALGATRCLVSPTFGLVSDIRCATVHRIQLHCNIALQFTTTAAMATMLQQRHAQQAFNLQSISAEINGILQDVTVLKIEVVRRHA